MNFDVPPNDENSALNDGYTTNIVTLNGQSFTIVSYSAVPSTMDVAVRAATDEDAAWTVVHANTQTLGRGTKGRSWASSPGEGLWFSIILPPPGDVTKLQNIPALAAKSICEAFAEHGLSGCTVKPPNDVIVSGKKIAGVLCESMTVKNSIQRIVVGMGINIMQSVQTFIDDGLPEATSYTIETGCMLDKESLFVSVLSNFHGSYRSLL